MHLIIHSLAHLPVTFDDGDLCLCPQERLYWFEETDSRSLPAGSLDVVQTCQSVLRPQDEALAGIDWPKVQILCLDNK